MLEIHLLGQFKITLDGRTVEIPSRPAQSLLSYLAVTAPNAHRRERLAGLLWPDIPEEEARRNLRRALWHIRKATQGQIPLDADDITIAFQKDPKTCVDTQVFSQPVDSHVDNGKLIEIVSSYGGELLPGFYDEWVILERERLQVIYEKRMKLLLEKLVEGRAWQEVSEWAERWIALGEAAEPAYRALMRVYAAQGDHSGLARTFQRCSEALQRTLGVEPSDETLSLYKEFSQAKQPLKHNWTARSDTQLKIQYPVAKTQQLSEVEPSVSPFKGLQFFDEADAGLFFGRESLTAGMLKRLGFPSSNGLKGKNLLVIVGASGVGKSSLVRAGIVPAIRASFRAGNGANSGAHESWKIVIFTPCDHPLEILAANLTSESESLTAATQLLDDMKQDPRCLRLFTQRSPLPLLLVIDQFEELFTLTRDEEERQVFIENILSASQGGRCKIILTLRADFYAHCAKYDSLRDVLSDSQEYIGPMNATELRRAIEEPARRTGISFEPGLVELILHEASDEPGSLPLVSHALLETWKRRDGQKLTLSGYAETGGVHAAIARTAESLYIRLTPEQQAVARNIFLRLTELGDGVQDTRRRVAPEELIPINQDAQTVEEVLNMLAEARLVTINQGSVEVAHEALIRQWPTLREWLTEDRESLRMHRRLTEASHGWQELSCEQGELYRGARLAQSIEWATTHSSELNELERSFLVASQELATQEQAEREAAQKREVEAARRFAEAEQQRASEQAHTAHILRWLAGSLGVILLVALLMAGFALQQRNRVQFQADLAVSRELAASAVTNLTVDPELSMLLSLQALKTAYTQEAEDALHQAIQSTRLVRTFPALNNNVVQVTASVDGKVAASSYDPLTGFTTEVWDMKTGEKLLQLPGELPTNTWPFPGKIATLVEKPENKNFTQLVIWDVNSGEAISWSEMDFQLAWSKNIALSRDWSLAAATLSDGTTAVYLVATGDRLLTIGKHGEPSHSVAFSPDGKEIITTVAGSTQLFDISTGRSRLTLPSVDYGTGAVEYGKNEIWAAIVVGQTIKIVDTQTGNTQMTLWGRSGEIYGIDTSISVFRLLAAGGSDNKVYLWDPHTGQVRMILAGHQASVNAVSFVPWQSKLVSGSSDGTVRLWDVSQAGSHELATFFDIGGKAYTGVVYSPDGKVLAVSGGSQAGDVFDASTGQRLFSFRGQFSNWIGRSAYSPDGKSIATTSGESKINIWDSGNGEKKQAISGFENWVGDLAYSPDGSHLATLDYDGIIRIWDSASGTELQSMKAFTEPVGLTQVIDVDYSPDGKQLASTGGSQVILWDAQSGKKVKAFPTGNDPVNAVAFSPNGKYIGVGGSGNVFASLWEISTGKNLVTFIGHQGPIQAILFSRDDKQVITGSEDGKVKIWDAETGQELLTLTRQNAQITDMAISPDGTHLAVTSNDGVGRVYYLKITDLIQAATQRLTRSFSLEECQKYLHDQVCPVGP